MTDFLLLIPDQYIAVINIWACFWIAVFSVWVLISDKRLSYQERKSWPRKLTHFGIAAGLALGAIGATEVVFENYYWLNDFIALPRHNGTMLYLGCWLTCLCLGLDWLVVELRKGDLRGLF